MRYKDYTEVVKKMARGELTVEQAEAKLDVYVERAYCQACGREMVTESGQLCMMCAEKAKNSEAGT